MVVRPQLTKYKIKDNSRTEKQIKVDGNCLQEEAINAPVYVLQWLRASDFILSLVGESISGNTEQVDASIF